MWKNIWFLQIYEKGGECFMSILEKANALANKLAHISLAKKLGFAHDALTDGEVLFVKNNTHLFSHDELVAAGL